MMSPDYIKPFPPSIQKFYSERFFGEMRPERIATWPEIAITALTFSPPGNVAFTSLLGY